MYATVYMVTFTINIPPMLAYIPAPWILWDMELRPADQMEQGENVEPVDQPPLSAEDCRLHGGLAGQPSPIRQWLLLDFVLRYWMCYLHLFAIYIYIYIYYYIILYYIILYYIILYYIIYIYIL